MRGFRPRSTVEDDRELLFNFVVKVISEGVINGLADSYPFPKFILLIPLLMPIKKLIDKPVLDPLFFLLINLETLRAFFYEILLILV